MNNYKSYSELQEELGENYPFKLYEMGISALKEIERLNQELQRKDNIINELKKWLDEEKDIQGTTIENKIYYEILDKIKELENDNKTR